MRAHVLSILTSLAIGLTACNGGGSGSGSGLSGSPRAFTRTDSAVTALPNTSGGYTATQVVTLSNDDAGASHAAVSLVNVNGNVTSSASSGGYQIQVTLQADAPTEAQARAALATMTVEHRDAVGADTLYLNNEVKFAQYSDDNVNRTATVTAGLPGTLDYQLHESTVNGTSATSGLGGPEAQLYSTNGSITLAGAWDVAAANTVNGTVSASGDIASLQASSTTGSVQTALSGMRDSYADLDSTAGSIDAKVSRTLTSGFDLEGRSDLGTVAIVVAGTEPVGSPSNSSAHYRSPDYDSGSPRVRINAVTGVVSRVD